MVKEREFQNPMLQIRVSPELEQRLNRVADIYGVTRNEVARMAIGQYVGQITGAIDSAINKMTDSMMNIDMEKAFGSMLPQMMDKMIPLLMEADKQNKEV